MGKICVDEKTKALFEENARKEIGKSFKMVSCEIGSEFKSAKYSAVGRITWYDGTAKVSVDFSEDGQIKYWSMKGDSIELESKRQGTIYLQDVVRLSDPSYRRNVWCAVQLKNVKPGPWDVYVAAAKIDIWGHRTYILELYHQNNEDFRQWHREEAVLGVDSGTMSVFDDYIYCIKDGSEEKFEKDESAKWSFREKCYEAADSGDCGFYIQEGRAVGVVCKSGIGDGSYHYSVEKDRGGRIIAIQISFL